MNSLYIVAYDIADHKRLYRVARLLENYGTRVQKSVFECWLAEADRRALFDQLAELIDNNADRLRYYRLCASCREWAGFQTLTPRAPAFWIIGADARETAPRMQKSLNPPGQQQGTTSTIALHAQHDDL